MQNDNLQMPRIFADLKAFFDSCSVPAYLVGGYIRDTLLGSSTQDIDIALHADPFPLAQKLAQQFAGSYIPLSPEHNVARIVVDKPSYGRWTIDISGFSASIDHDLRRRDFTADALALSVAHWDQADWVAHIIDPLDGLADLENKTIRAAGNSVFKNDPVRLLRAVRLSAQLGFGLDPETAGLMREDAPLLGSALGDRVRNELLAVIASKEAKAHLRTLDNLGLLCVIIPELTAAKGVAQPKEHYWDVFDHSLEAVGAVEKVLSHSNPKSAPDELDALVPWNPEIDDHFRQEVSDGHTRATILKLGALLHDIAKPQTKMIDAKGKTRFLGHHSLGAAASKDIMSRLRVSNRGADMVGALIENHLRPMQMRHGADMPTHKAIYKYFRDVGDAAIDTLYLSLADHLAARGPTITLEGWKEHIAITEHIIGVGTGEQAPGHMPRLITGHDLIDKLGLEPSPLMGKILEDVRVAQAAGEISDADSALELAQNLVSGNRCDESSGNFIGTKGA